MTPGQAAYEASLKGILARPAGGPHPPWNKLPAHIREAWETVAKAAVDAHIDNWLNLRDVKP